MEIDRHSLLENIFPMNGSDYTCVSSTPCAFPLVEVIPSNGSHCFYWIRGIQRSTNHN